MDQSRQCVTKIISFLPWVSLIHYPCTVLWNLPLSLFNPSKGWDPYWFFSFASFPLVCSWGQLVLMESACAELFIGCCLYGIRLYFVNHFTPEITNKWKWNGVFTEVSSKTHIDFSEVTLSCLWITVFHPWRKFRLNNHHVRFKSYFSICQNPVYWCEQRGKQCPLRPFRLGDLKSQGLSFNEKLWCCGHLTEEFPFILSRPTQSFRVIKSYTKVSVLIFICLFRWSHVRLWHHYCLINTKLERETNNQFI